MQAARCRDPSSFSFLLAFPAASQHTGPYESGGMEGEGAGPPEPPPSSFSTFLLHVRPPGCGSFHTVAVATDCVSPNPGPGPLTPQGVERWVCSFRQQVDTAPGPSHRPVSAKPDPQLSSAPARAALPPPEDRCLPELPELAFYFGHSVLLPENSTSLSSSAEMFSRCSFFKKRSCWPGGLVLALVSAWPCVLEGEQREGRSWQKGAPCGLK